MEKYLILIIFCFCGLINSQNLYLDTINGIEFNEINVCGDQILPCKSFSDISKSLFHFNYSTNVAIVINSTSLNQKPIESGDSFGNVFGLCGFSINYSPTVSAPIAITINGNSSNQPFLSIIETNNGVQNNNCVGPRLFKIFKINFQNWNDKSIFKININQKNYSETIQENEKVILYSVGYFTNSSSIIYSQPKNSFEFYNSDQVSIQFVSNSFYNISSTFSSVNIPGTNILVSPIHIIGGSLIGLNTITSYNFYSCYISLTPFIYINGGQFFKGNNKAPVFTLIENNNFINHPIIVVVNPNILLNQDQTFKFATNDISTVSSFIQVIDENSPSTFFSGNMSISSYGSYSFAKVSKSYINHIYGNSVFSFQNQQSNLFNLNFDVDFGGSILLDEDFIFSLTNTNSSISLVGNFKDFIFETNNSNIFLSKIYQTNANTTSKYPFVGYNSDIFMPSTIKFMDNSTFCLCSDCQFTQYDELSAIKELSIDQLYCTEKPSSEELGNTEGSSDNKKRNNIIIVVVILGVASISSLVGFSVVFKRRRDKKYLLDSSKNASATTSELGESTGASTDNDVSPSLEPTIFEEDEDYAGLEKL